MGNGMAEISLPAPRKALRIGLSEAWFAWVLVFPALAFIGVIVAWPLLETIRLSFTDADLGSENWVGLANYEKLLSSANFYAVVGRTFFWMVLSVSLKPDRRADRRDLAQRRRAGRALFRMLIMPPWGHPDCHRLHRLVVAGSIMANSASCLGWATSASACWMGLF